MENKLYIGNLVSFVDTEYFVELQIVKENALLYKIDNTYYIDVSNIEENEIEKYVELNKEDRKKCISNLPVCKIFVDDKNLNIYKPKTYKLVR